MTEFFSNYSLCVSVPLCLYLQQIADQVRDEGAKPIYIIINYPFSIINYSTFGSKLYHRYLVAYGEKSFKSIQIKQIYFERFEKILSDFCHEVTLIIRHLVHAKLELINFKHRDTECQSSLLILFSVGTERRIGMEGFPPNV